MKKIATFTYGLIFACSMALIALLVVVTIGKYDYKWEYKDELPPIDPEYGEVTTVGDTSMETTVPDEIMSVLTVSDVGGWSLSNGYYKCAFKIREIQGGAATISYIEYTLYEDNVCFGVYYEPFTDDLRDENAYIEPVSEKDWSANLPYNEKITTLRIRIVWRDSEGTLGENFITVGYGQ